jgi:hypothetical protein
MVPTEAREMLLVVKFIGAIAYLEDITTIHTDPNLASMRTNLMRGGSDDAVSDDMVRAFEVLGIANAVDDRFRGTSKHHPHAIQAAFHAGTLFAEARKWLILRDAGAGAPALGESDNGYRAFLLTHLDWVHNYGTVRDGALADASTCLCPVTAYLQLILRNTPIEDWAVAAAEPDASPLAFAWAWARTSPSIGRQTADVAVLVAMGRQVHRLIVDAPLRAKRAKAAAKDTTKILSEGVSVALAGAVKDCVIGAATWVRSSPSVFKDYKRVPEAEDAEELRMIVQNAAEKLGEQGERYAQLLGEKDVAQERERVVVSIRTLAGFILGKAEPPVPENVLLAVADLATAG